MSAKMRIQRLVQTTLSDNHNVEGVEFIDQLLQVAADVGEVKCTLSEEGALRVEISGEPALDFTLGRAKSKIRLLCVRLSVLCRETRGQDVSPYGGEGFIERELRPSQHPSPPHETPHDSARQNGPSSGQRSEARAASAVAAENPAGKFVTKWAVSFKNTASEQEFIIRAQ
jgi:hypothetical protein